MIELYLFHPVLVHFTIALFSLSVLFDILGKLTKLEGFRSAAWFNLIFASLSVIATVIFGLIAESRAPHTDAGHELLETHETIGFIVLGIIFILTIWRIILKSKLPVKGLAIYFVFSVLGVGLMFVGGYYGGEMVYTHGYGVKAAMLTTEHIHSEGKTHGHSPTELDEHHQNMPDSTKMHQGKVHEHKDGAKHVH
jgi:uncharacterized membrane protein